MRKRVSKLVKSILHNVRRPEMQILPAHLAFYFVLTLVPIVALFANVLTFFNLSGDYVSNVILNYLPSAAADIIIGISSGSSMHIQTMFLFIPIFVIASNGMNSIIVTSNSIYKIKNKGFINARIKSIIMLIFLLLLFIIILLVPVFGNLLFKIIADLADTDVGHISLLVFRILKYPLSFMLIYFFVKLLYVMAPDTSIKSSAVTYGSLFTTIIWIIATVVFSFYVENFANYATFYGSISSIIILMFWVYILAYVFVLGMAMNATGYELDRKLEFSVENEKE